MTNPMQLSTDDRTLTADDLEDKAFAAGVQIEMSGRWAYATIAGTKYRAPLKPVDA